LRIFGFENSNIALVTVAQLWISAAGDLHSKDIASRARFPRLGTTQFPRLRTT
jgi:hypothetical protein